MEDLKTKGRIMVGVIKGLCNLCATKGGISLNKLRKAINDVLESVSLDKKSLKIIADDLGDTLKDVLDDGSKLVVEELITHLPGEAKIKVLAALTPADRKKLSNFSPQMNGLVSHYEKQIEARSKMNTGKITTVAALLKFCRENAITFGDNLRLAPPEAGIVGIQFKNEVRFSLDTGNYTRGKILISIPANML